MATMLTLPREVYLIICSDLTFKDLARLSCVSRDHNLAVQQPLFLRIRVTSFGALIKLVDTLTNVPAISCISQRQRLHSHQLSDAELRERDIRHLDVVLDVENDRPNVTGALLSRCVNAISRQFDRVKIVLTLLSLSEKLVNELSSAALPNVFTLTMFLGDDAKRPEGTDRALRNGDNVESLKKKIWAFTFSGSTFPDLKTVYMNNLIDRPENLPSNMERGFDLAERSRPRRNIGPPEDDNSGGDGSFNRLAKMEEIKLEFNTLLDATVLNSLFGSRIIPQWLTKLEIVNCPSLHPIADLEALATLLRGGLQLLQFLKVHLTSHFDGHVGFEMAYASKIQDNPGNHLCNIVRELGQKIKVLDLALPFACKQMFVPPPKDHDVEEYYELDLPQFEDFPIHTFGQRMVEAGYRYRRLIFYYICGDGHEWEEIADVAVAQGENILWDIVYDNDENRQGWSYMSGCRPIGFDVQTQMQLAFDF